MRTQASRDRLWATVFLAGLGAAAAWTSMTGVAPGEVSFVPCPVHALTGVPCPGCGMTRACVAVARGDLSAAWSFHPFALLLVPIAVMLAAFPTWTRASWERAPNAMRRHVTGIAIAACLVLWLVR